MINDIAIALSFIAGLLPNQYNFVWITPCEVHGLMSEFILIRGGRIYYEDNGELASVPAPLPFDGQYARVDGFSELNYVQLMEDLQEQIEFDMEREEREK